MRLVEKEGDAVMCSVPPAPFVAWSCGDVNCCSMTPAPLTQKRTEILCRFRDNRLFLFCSSKMNVLLDMKGF